MSELGSREEREKVYASRRYVDNIISGKYGTPLHISVVTISHLQTILDVQKKYYEECKELHQEIGRLRTENRSYIDEIDKVWKMKELVRMFKEVMDEY